jgi:hypothetical protein
VSISPTFYEQLLRQNSFRQKITNPNCKHIKGVQGTLVWKSCLWNIGEIDSHTKVLCTAFKCLQFGFVIFWQKGFGANAAHKMLVKLTPGLQMISFHRVQTNEHTLSRSISGTEEKIKCQCYKTFFSSSQMLLKNKFMFQLFNIWEWSGVCQGSWGWMGYYKQ